MWKGFTVWLTGLSGAGKTTLTGLMADSLRKKGIQNIEVLDGDIVRKNFSKGLGFSREDRDTNIRRIGFVSDLLTRNGVVVIVAAISPYRTIREELRGKIKRFIEVYVDAPLEACESRDVKGLYASARSGKIKGFTGIDDPYEAPLTPEVVCHTDKESPLESASKIMSYLQLHGYISGNIPFKTQDNHGHPELNAWLKDLPQDGGSIASGDRWLLQWVQTEKNRIAMMKILEYYNQHQVVVVKQS